MNRKENKQNQEKEIDLEELKKKNKLKPCKENNLITQNGSIRENVGVTDKAKILME